MRTGVHSGLLFLSCIFLSNLAAPGYSQQWEQIMMNPGVFLTDLHMLPDGQRGWALGNCGAGSENIDYVLHTDNSGATWSGISFPENALAVQGVFFISENKGWIVGNSGSIYATQDGGATWIPQNSNSNRGLKRVMFVNENEGWITGGFGDGSSYLVLHTENGGQTWENQSFGTDAYECSDLFFTDVLNGWICGSDTTLNRQIHHTQDGGQTWARQTVPPGSPYSTVSSIGFATPDIGWAVTSSIYDSSTGAILYTQNGGENWTVQEYTNLDYNYELHCQDTQHVAITSSQVLSPQKQKIFFTVDGGTTWQSRNVPMNSYSYGVYIQDSLIRVIGDDSRILSTPDLGDTWSWEHIAPFWLDMAWSDLTHAWLVTGSQFGEDGYCLRTDDGGQTWYHDENAPGGVQVIFHDAIHGWMLWDGNMSKVWRTEDGGTTWSSFNVGTSNWVGKIFFIDEMSGWAYGSNGTIRASQDGGKTWESQSSGVGEYVETVFFINTEEGWAAGGYGGANGFIIHTADGGETWSPQTPANSNHYMTGYFLDKDHGWLAAYGGNIHFTSDGGKTWSKIGSVSHMYVQDFFMADELNGWLLAGNHSGGAPGEDGKGLIYSTEDGGVSWNLEWESPWPQGWVNGLSRNTDGRLWVCGTHNTLLAQEGTFVTPTPTLTPEPTPTPTQPCETLGCDVFMPSAGFGPGDACYCDVVVCNPSGTTYSNVPLFVILDVYGMYFFAPGFTEFDYYPYTLEPGASTVHVIPEFAWPGGAGSGTATWYAAMTNEQITELFGEFGMLVFTWHD